MEANNWQRVTIIELVSVITEEENHQRIMKKKQNKSRECKDLKQNEFSLFISFSHQTSDSTACFFFTPSYLVWPKCVMGLVLKYWCVPHQNTVPPK